MKTVIAVLVFAALAAVIFAAWGMYSDAGHIAFDEMDGLYPFFAGVAGVFVLSVLSAFLALRHWLAGRKAQGNDAG